MQIASETTRQRVLALPAGVERVRDGFMTFSHLWTRPLAEALQVLPPKEKCINICSSARSGSPVGVGLIQLAMVPALAGPGCPT